MALPIKKKRAHIHLKRVESLITSVDHSQVYGRGRIILNDLCMQGVHLFTDVVLPTDSDVIIVLEHPKKLALRARVLWSQGSVPMSHVLSTERFQYEMNVMFLFQSMEEQNELAQFIEEVGGVYLYRNYGAAA